MLVTTRWYLVILVGIPYEIMGIMGISVEKYHGDIMGSYVAMLVIARGYTVHFHKR